MLVQNMSKPNHSSRGGVLYALITRGESESGGMLVLYCIPAVPAVALFPQVFSNLLKAQQLQLEGASNSTAAK